MNFFKNVIPLIVLFYINATNAKSMGGSRPAATPAPAKVPVAQQPAVRQPSIQQPTTPSFAKSTTGTQEKSYKDLVNYVKSASDVWDRAEAKFTPRFVNSTIEKVQKLNLDDMQLETLLQIARDIHGVFSGNQRADTAILNAIDSQINEAIILKNMK